MPLEHQSTEKESAFPKDQAEVELINLVIRSPFPDGKAYAQTDVDILSSEHFLPIFTTHIESEFSKENLDFVLEICDFQRRAVVGKAPDLEELQTLYNTYIPQGSPREINIPSPLRDETKRLLEEAAKPAATENDRSPEIFQQATTAIIKLMDSDSKTRFIKSPQYTEACRFYNLKIELKELTESIKDSTNKNPETIERIKIIQSKLDEKETADFNELVEIRKKIIGNISDFTAMDIERNKNKSNETPIKAAESRLARIQHLDSMLEANEANFLKKFGINKEKEFEVIKKEDAVVVEKHSSELFNALTTIRQMMIAEQTIASAQLKILQQSSGSGEIDKNTAKEIKALEIQVKELDKKIEENEKTVRNRFDKGTGNSDANDEKMKIFTKMLVDSKPEIDKPRSKKAQKLTGEAPTLTRETLFQNSISERQRLITGLTIGNDKLTELRGNGAPNEIKNMQDKIESIKRKLNENEKYIGLNFDKSEEKNLLAQMLTAEKQHMPQLSEPAPKENKASQSNTKVKVSAGWLAAKLKAGTVGKFFSSMLKGRSIPSINEDPKQNAPPSTSPLANQPLLAETQEAANVLAIRLTITVQAINTLQATPPELKTPAGPLLTTLKDIQLSSEKGSFVPPAEVPKPSKPLQVKVAPEQEPQTRSRSTTPAEEEPPTRPRSTKHKI